MMELLQGVRKLEFDRADLHRQQPKPEPQVRAHPAADPAMGSADPLTTHTATVRNHWFDHGIGKKLQRRIRAGKYPIEAQLDLHGFRQQAALHQLDDFLRGVQGGQRSLVLVIHGKGNRSRSQAKLRPLVRQRLLLHSRVLGYCPAQPVHGGSGASYVLLKSST